MVSTFDAGSSTEGVRAAGMADWVMMLLEQSEGDNEPENDDDGASPIIYPGKALAVHEGRKGALKALSHSTECSKVAMSAEGPAGNSQLIRRCCLELHQSNGKPRMRSVSLVSIQHAAAVC